MRGRGRQPNWQRIHKLAQAISGTPGLNVNQLCKATDIPYNSIVSSLITMDKNGFPISEDPTGGIYPFFPSHFPESWAELCVTV